MQPNQTPATPGTPPNNYPDQPLVHREMTIQPLSSEEQIREATDENINVVPTPAPIPTEVQFALNPDPEQQLQPELKSEATPLAVAPIAVAPIESQLTAKPKTKKHLILFIIFTLATIAQIYLFGDLALGAVDRLNSTQLVGYLTPVLLSFVVLIQFICLYKTKGFGLVTWKEKIFSILAVLPAVLSYVLSGLMILSIHLMSFKVGLDLLMMIVIINQLGFYILPIAVIGLDTVINKRKGIKRALSLWPILVVFAAATVTVFVVGSPESNRPGIAKEVQLEKAEKDMSSHLKDTYGMDFKVSDAKYDEKSEYAGSKYIVMKVSPLNDPSFSYNASLRYDKNVSYETGEITEETKYREFFLGAYWISGFENTVCPEINSLQKELKVINCKVTYHNLKSDYKKTLAKYRGNVPAYSQLDKEQKSEINFSLIVETEDVDNINNVIKHAGIVDGIVKSVIKTNSTSHIEYYAHSTNETSSRIGFFGITNVGALSGKTPILNLMYEQSASLKKSPYGPGILYYNSVSGKFDLPKPVVNAK